MPSDITINSLSLKLQQTNLPVAFATEPLLAVQTEGEQTNAPYSLQFVMYLPDGVFPILDIVAFSTVAPIETEAGTLLGRSAAIEYIRPAAGSGTTYNCWTLELNYVVNANPAQVVWSHYVIKDAENDPVTTRGTVTTVKRGG